MDFENLVSVILLLVAAGLMVLAGLPVIRKWQRDRESRAVSGPERRGATVGLDEAAYGPEVPMEEHGRREHPDQPRSADAQPYDYQDEQMRNRPADEQHHRPSHLGGTARPRPADEHDPRSAHSNGHAYAAYGEYDDDGFDEAFEDASEPMPAAEVNGRYGADSDDARRAAHFDWKVAAQYERARAARNAAMSAFEPPPLPDDGPGTFTEEIPAIHAADGQRRHPAVQPDPQVQAPFGQRQMAGPPSGAVPGEPQPAVEGYDDPWGQEAAAHAPPAYQFDDQPDQYGQYPPYEAQQPVEPGFDQGQQAPFGGFPGPEEDRYSPPPHMRWQPDPETEADPAAEPSFPGQPAAPGPRQAFTATTFRVQPAVEEPLPMHVAGEQPGTVEPTNGYDPTAYADPQGYEVPAAGEPVTPTDHAAQVGQMGQVGYDEPAAPHPVFHEPVEAPAPAEPEPAFTHAFRDEPRPPEPEPKPSRPPLPDLSPLLAEDEVTDLRRRWNEIKGEFPDDPVNSVKQASKLVGECTELFERRLGVDPENSDVSTEDLRQALQRYLAFFERMLSS